MASIGKIDIALSDDTWSFVNATRMIHCQADKCVNHNVNNDRFGQHGDCILKRIYMTEEGACMQYEAKGES